MSPQPSIARYRILAKLGEGGMGEVWRAADGKLVLALITPDAQRDRQNAHATILVNFFDELKRRVP